MRGNKSRKSTRVIALAGAIVASVVLLSMAGTVAWAWATQAPVQPSGQNSGRTAGQASTPPAARPVNQPRQEDPDGPQAQNATRYMPAKVLSAADVKFPLQTTADAIVVFDVSVGVRGEASKIAVLRGVPPFTAAAEQSLHDWKFASAAQNGRAENSEMLVAFVFRHAVYVANPPSFAPLYPGKESDGGRSDFIAPAILHAAYADYPPSTVAQGAMVVQANIKPDGSTGSVDVLRDLPGGFAPLATNAAKQWRFQSALRDGRNVASNVAIAFVFSSRSLNPF